MNTLQIQPHLVKPNLNDEYIKGYEAGYIVWRVTVDNRVLADEAHPFTIADTHIELAISRQFPIWGDGSQYTCVRRVGPVIVWGNLPRRLSQPPLCDQTLFSGNYFFNAVMYEDVIAKAYAVEKQMVGKSLFVRRQNDNDMRKRVSWQYLTAEELAHIIRATYPRSMDAVYRTPSHAGDVDGRLLLNNIQHAIQAINLFEVVPPPHEVITVRIGLDENPFTEAIWHIGKQDGRFAVYFEQRPYLPLWLASPALDRVWRQEPFAKDL